MVKIQFRGSWMKMAGNSVCLLFNCLHTPLLFILIWQKRKNEYQTKTKLFLADGLLARLKDGRLVLEAKKELDEDDPNYDEDYEGDDE